MKRFNIYTEQNVLCTEILKEYGLRTPACRKNMRAIAEKIAAEYDCGIKKLILTANGVKWIAPRRRKNESAGGYMARLRNWLNIFIVESMDVSWDGDILGLPDDYRMEVIESE